MPTLHWLGKDKVINHHQDVPFRLLDHQYGARPDGTQTAEPTGSGNQIIHGDNLEALKSLLPRYEGRVKCIYIDPPYNTGNEGWVYNDNVNDPKIKKWLSQVVGKEGEDLSRHDKWLCMMYPRLKLLHKLLAEDGAIFISIDDNEQAHLKLLADEIFGGANFVNSLIWEKKFSPQNDARYFSENHDFIVCFAKNKSKWERNLLTRTEEQDDRYKNPDDDFRGVWTSSDLTRPEHRDRDFYGITTPSGKVLHPAKGRSWSRPLDELERLKAENRLWFGPKGDNMPRLKRFLSETKPGVVPQTIWKFQEVGHTQEAKQEINRILHDVTSFPTPKPTRLIERILQLATDKDSIVLDSFAGSGTTAHAVLKLNQQDGGHRKFILTEMEDYAEHITAERVKRVMRGYASQPGTGGSFDYLTLGEPVFTDNGELNERAGLSGLRQYLYYAETKQALPPAPAEADNAAFLALHDDTAYYFHYAPDAVTTLNHDFLATMRTRAGQYIIYADNCLLPAEFLTQHGIIFKKIPRDISRF